MGKTPYFGTDAAIEGAAREAGVKGRQTPR
jgi:hypothetical protein